jgi:tRNA-Thr(GGU) m(6)t(6)A37 methyltransferase TsaA
MNEIIYRPIGIFKCAQKQPATSPQQATHNAFAKGVVQLHTDRNFEQALDSIEGFSHLWILFHFHQNETWKPMVQPPRGSPQKRGVFATRSPYRPNGIGMSVVELVRKIGLELHVRSHDLLDGTPILDIKPYLTYADSFPQSSLGWTENLEAAKYKIQFTEAAEAQLQFLEQHGELQLRAGILSQLQFDPTSNKQKRISQTTELEFIFSFRTWRVRFLLQQNAVQVLRIYSGYLQENLAENTDPYQDKDLHRKFKAQFLD